MLSTLEKPTTGGRFRSEPFALLKESSPNARSLTAEFVFSPLRHWANSEPEKVAIIAAGVEITYADLESQTNRMARVLRARGIRRGDAVALVLPRGVNTILALIAVLKAGAAYVPLDSESPAERVRLCLEDASPRLVIREKRVTPSSATPDEPGAGDAAPEEMLLAELLGQADRNSSDPFLPGEIGLSANDVAYTIFTSGTTGRSKGVPITHRSLSNFVQGNQGVCIRVDGDDRVFQGFSPASDGHHEEVWPTLLAGAILVVATTDDVHSGQDLEAFLIRHGVSIISCAPTLLSMVEGDVPSLRRILFGAERCPPDLIQRWWRPGREIINTYGPTEATVGATFALCSPGETVTIGKPLPNYYCYVLDERLQPRAPGEEGELCIAGVGLSSGYLGNPALTAEKFLPNPFVLPGCNNDILYRTGDRARENEDGDIEWLGRMDGQIKVRGYRIELSDIESHLMSEDAVRSVAVIVRRADTPSAALVALLVPKTGLTVDAEGCFARLRQSLPAYMIPQTLEVVERLPVLPSGKIDRRAVQSLSGTALKAERLVVLPRTASEKLLFGVWQMLFPDAVLSVTDDFFLDLGGYSLLATRFMSLLRHEHGFPGASVRAIYEHPTLEKFAGYLDSQMPRPVVGTRTDSATPGGAGRPGNAAHGFAPVPRERYAVATLWQGLGILFLFFCKALFWLAPIVAADYCDGLGYSPLVSVGAGLLLHAISIPVILLFTVAAKWLLVGRFRAGEYPMWGGYFVRWWLVQRLFDLAPKDYLTGTPLASVYLRMLGAKVGHNVLFDSLEVDCPDLIEIGSDTNVESLAWVRASWVADGWLQLRPIRIGRGTLIGVRSGVAGGAVLGTGATLADLSCAGTGIVIPDGEEWAGSPARPRDFARERPYDPAKQPTPATRAGYGLCQMLLLMVLPFIELAPFCGTALLLNRLNDAGNASGLGGIRVTALLTTPAYAFSLIAVVCVQILLVKWLVIGRVRAGTYSTHGFFALRKWFVDKLMDLHKGTLMPIYDTLYTRPWCIALGMKCGPRVEIALPSRLPYDLIELGEESFLASDLSIGLPCSRNGLIHLEPTIIGRRAFIGNNSVVPQGANVPDGSLLGALSVCPRESETGREPGQSWLGSPAFRLHRRQHAVDADPRRTYAPTAALYAERLAWETLRILLPNLAMILIAFFLTQSFFRVWHSASLGVAVAAIPVLYVAASLVGIGFLWLAKRGFIGTYRARTEPLWSRYVWNSETFSMFFHDFAAALFVSSLTGTEYFSRLLRFMGAKIGDRAFIDTTDLTEFDLLHIGEDAAINFNAPLQAHLFEDRMMKVGPVSVGDRCSVGNYSVVLFDTVLEPGSRVDHVSLVMRGERLPANTTWAGSPAQSQSEERRAHAAPTA